MDKNTKRNLSLFAFVIVTLYSLLSNNWILWAVITLMLFIDSVADSFKEWFEKRQEIDLVAKKSMHSLSSDNLEKIMSIEKSISQIEKRLEELENYGR